MLETTLENSVNPLTSSLSIEQFSCSRNRNKISIQKTCPVIEKDKLSFNNQNCLLGISINSPATVGNKILAIFDFLNKRGLNQINLLIGDSLYRHTAMIKHRCNESEGTKIAMLHSKDLLHYYMDYEYRYNPPYKLNFFLASEVAKADGFQIMYKNLWKLFETHSEFRKSVLDFSSYYLGRVFENSNQQSMVDDKFFECAIKYLIEELCLFALLKQCGLNMLIYPGVIQTIYDIITMDEPYISQLFKDYIFVSLRLKSR